MLNNDVLRRIRYALNLNDRTMLEIFVLGHDHQITRDSLLALLKKENEEGFVAMSNQQLTDFLDGLITYKRGQSDKPAGPVHVELDNNVILRKLRIALAFKDGDILTILKVADFILSKHELSAFSRHKDHKHYRKCGDQILRHFLQGLTIHLRHTPSD